MKLGELIKTVFWCCFTIACIVEAFYLIVYNPTAVSVGDTVYRHGHMVEATQWDVIYSYIYPIYWIGGAGLVLIVFVLIIDIIWQSIINSIPGDW